MKFQAAGIVIFVAILIGVFSCSDKSTGGGALDLTVVGKWQGAIGAIPAFDFKGEKIFVDIARADSSFRLVTRDTARAAVPSIKDTMVVLTGVWRLNSSKDSVLLVCDSCRVVDTAQNVLSQRQVQGQIIPIALDINRQSNGLILWQIRLSDFTPLIPLIGLDLSAVPTEQLKALLFATMVGLEKTSQ